MHGLGEEIGVDARPSDAVNLAVRFNAPIYVNREVADQMKTSPERAMKPSDMDVVKACREEIAMHNDPTVMLKLQMQMAIAEERYSHAAKLRDEIDRLLSSDRVLSLIVAIESALKDLRFDDALQIRDELKRIRSQQGEEDTKKQESR